MLYTWTGAAGRRREPVWFIGMGPVRASGEKKKQLLE